MAKSTGKKTINTGVKIVPKPNPEKNVRMEARKAVTDMMVISILYGLFWWHGRVVEASDKDLKLPEGRVFSYKTRFY